MRISHTQVYLSIPKYNDILNGNSCVFPVLNLSSKVRITLLEKFLDTPPSPIFGWSYPLTPLLKHNRLDIATYHPRLLPLLQI